MKDAEETVKWRKGHGHDASQTKEEQYAGAQRREPNLWRTTSLRLGCSIVGDCVGKEQERSLGALWANIRLKLPLNGIPRTCGFYLKGNGEGYQRIL